MAGRLHGKRAVITGAAQGIGKAIAAAFAAEGAELLLADIDAERLAAAAAELGQEALVIDVARKAEIERLFARAAERWGGLDLLVNNAGVTHAAELDDLTEEDFDRVFAINLKSALWATQAAARLMDAGSAVVNMSSVNAVLGIPNQIPYALSKGAMKQLTNVTALSLAPRGIRVNAIGPGSIMTEMLKGIMTDQAAQDRILSRTPLGRCGEPAEVAAIAVFLASAESSYVTGQTIYADGGRLGLNYTVPVRPA
jgi:NAD(P)-dependent dehydrogenase (short-subunit alcohol dehydrogenase family)